MTRSCLRLAAAGLALIVIACQSRPLEPPHLARIGELTEAERRYGVAPVADRSITYRPDVVIVKGGPTIIRAAGATGLTWTIDPAAPGASNLAPGKIMFVTGRAVGRVLALKKTPAGLAVTVGPVELTEIVSHLEFSLDQPLDLTQVIEYEATERPIAAVAQSTADKVVVQRAVSRFGEGPFAIRPVLDVRGFNLWGFNGDAGVGLSLARTAEDGIRMQAGFVLALARPTIRVDLKINNGIERALIRVGGATEWRLTFSVASQRGVQGNVNEEIPVPKDWSIPITGAAAHFPFAVTVRHVFIVKTAFSSSGSLKAVGALKASGELAAGYANSQFQLTGPKLEVEQSFMQSLRGVSLGATGLVLAHEVRVIVGVGAFDFVTGPYVGLRTSLGVTQGSSIGLIQCKGGELDSSVTAGVGYSIPQPVTSAINFILRTLNAKEITGHGVLSAGTLPVFHAEQEPTAKICKGR